MSNLISIKHFFEITYLIFTIFNFFDFFCFSFAFLRSCFLACCCRVEMEIFGIFPSLKRPLKGFGKKLCNFVALAQLTENSKMTRKKTVETHRRINSAGPIYVLMKMVVILNTYCNYVIMRLCDELLMLSKYIP